MRDQIYHHALLPASLLRRQVFKRRSPSDSREQTCQRMADSSGLQRFSPIYTSQASEVCAGVNVGGGHEFRAIFRKMMSLAQQVGQRKPYVESGIPEMDHFMVEQDKFAVVEQNVLGAVIAMHDSEACVQRLLNQGFKKYLRLRDLFRGVAVIRFQAKCLENGAVAENFSGENPFLCRISMDSAEQARELLNVSDLDFASEENGLPVPVRLGYGGHCDHMRAAILEEKRRDGSGRRYPEQPFQPARFGVNPPRIAVPIYGDSQFAQRLFDYERRPGRTDNEHGSV